MLKADLANNDSNGVVGFILYPTFFFSLLFFPLRALQLQSDPEGMCHPLGRAVKVFMTVNQPPSSTRQDISVIAAMRDPNITLLARFIGLFIAPSKTLINNVSHTNSRVVKSFLYWNFCSTLFCTFYYTYSPFR